MSNKPGGKRNPLAAAERADRNRKIFIQAAVAVVLVALVAAIGIGIAVKNSRDNDPGSTPAIAATTGQNTDGLTATITDTGAIRIGKPDAKVTLRVVADLQCPACKEQFEAGKGACYCEELHRRKTYDQERRRRGLVALYRPPSMR